MTVFDVSVALEDAGAELRPSDRDGVWRFRLDGRRGWAWLDYRGDDPVVHLSLLMADGAADVDRLRDVVAGLPAPPFCEFDHFHAEDDVFIRLVARFGVGPQPDSISIHLRRMVEIVQLVDHLPVDVERPVGAGAVSDLWATLSDIGVAAPPVPAAVRHHLVSVGPWWWGSVLMHPFNMYMFDSGVELIDMWDRSPLFAMSHSGHGVNSFGLNVAVAAGPVAAFVQHGFGSAYSDPVRSREQIAATYARLHQVLNRAEDDPGPARWLLLMSTFRSIYELVDLDGVRQSGVGRAAAERLQFADEHALWQGLVDRLPYDFDIGARIRW